MNRNIKLALLSTIVYAIPLNASAAPATDLVCVRCVGASDLETASITSTKIKNGQIKTADLAKNAITTAKIKDGEVRSADIGTGAINSIKIKDGQVKMADIAVDAINSARIKDGQVKSVDIADNSISSAKLDSILLGRIEELERIIAAQSVVFDYLDFKYVTDLNTGNTYPTLQIIGANLQIINGVDQTTTNGTGNLVVGYLPSTLGGIENCSNGFYKDEASCVANSNIWSSVHTSGSHNIVGGTNNDYPSTGTIIGGKENITSAANATVTGGSGNSATGINSSVSGGNNRTANGRDDWVAGTLFEED